MPIVQSRRHLLTNIAVAGATGFAGLGAAGLHGGRKSLAAEPPPEITTIRFEKDPVTCLAPQAAEDLLRAEGFTDIRYVDITDAHVRRAETARSGAVGDMFAHNEVDFARTFVPSLIMAMEAGAPITTLAGLHVGCFEVFGKNDIRAMADLKGRTVGIAAAFEDELLVKIMAGLVGLDPAKDIRWVTSLSRGPMELFAEGKIDAFIAISPTLQEVRARNIGHVIVSSLADRPWSQYYCCFFAARTDFARAYPVATRRVLRAVLKAADLCASAPERIAQLLVDAGYTTRYDYALQALKGDIRYNVWRDYDSEDTLRFYALRMQEAGLIKSSPQKLIAEYTDWRFIDELKRELKI
ncbi:MAG: ABC transporter substrate-binding protein [Rhodopila sp.]|jgi:NitT/TauT family transport system substrate-binding protein